MIAVTKEQREELISHGKELIERISDHGDSMYPSRTIKIIEIALAALTVEPVNPADCFEPVYLSPPIPEIIFPEVKTRVVDGLLDIARDVAWWECIDEIKRINKLGEPLMAWRG
ncbi:hypothetical protein SAMN05216522_11740 [Rosenbergiella nectarea]|uniref:Uncharacterized protein n=1 Tax=Rosenbergiella nectarea TaxID=988801 RepID=A0A1H9MRD1_9GAMM|nr:hypothetical protein [Rosenbergiella nectarea]SER25965.1 hypothetical protein SAMN05216522_11740 [Rosenbergiella nectarea]